MHQESHHSQFDFVQRRIYHEGIGGLVRLVFLFFCSSGTRTRYKKSDP